MSRRDYDGPALDGTVQHITESRVWGDDGETVAATDDPDGEVTTEDVPMPRDAARPDDAEGQTRIDEWGWSA